MDIVRIVAEDIGLPEEIIREKFRSAEVVSNEKMLKVREQWRQGPAYTDEYSCSVIMGDVEMYEGERICEQYPYNCYQDIYYEPCSDVVIIRCRRYNDTVDPIEEYTEYYVWHSGKWLRIRFYK